jgi:glycosyltransferase EpsF
MIKVLQVTGTMNRGGAEVMIMSVFRNISSNF